MHKYNNVCAGCRFVEMCIVCKEAKKEGGEERMVVKGKGGWREVVVGGVNVGTCRL